MLVDYAAGPVGRAERTAPRDNDFAGDGGIRWSAMVEPVTHPGHHRAHPGPAFRVARPEFDVHGGVRCVDQRHGFGIRGAFGAG